MLSSKRVLRKECSLNTKRILLGITVLSLVLIMFTEIASTSQEPSTPTVWLRIHRIQAGDQIETASEDGADWLYQIYLWHGRIWDEKLWDVIEHKCEPDNDDIIVNETHKFGNVKTTTTTVIIDLLEDDPPYYDTADISSSVPERAPGVSVSGKRFRIRYDLNSNTIVEGDTVILVGGYYMTSGEYDDRDAEDEYDANLWFIIWDNLGPNAYFSYSPANPTVGEEVQFIDMSPDPERKVTSWLWNFGDGSSSNLKNPFHEYEKAGVYTVNLTVSDDEGVTGMMSQTLTCKSSSGIPLSLVFLVILIIGVALLIAKRLNKSKLRRKRECNEMNKSV
jgi:PKD repeat protein